MVYFRKNFVFINCFAYENQYCIFDCLLPFISLLSFRFSKKRLGDKTDSIQLQKELCSIQQRIDGILQSDTTLQQRFHCLGAVLGAEKVSIYFQNIPVDSFEVFKSAFKKIFLILRYWNLIF